ncbi:unnamed protein product [Fusarium graminearum]|uniref:Chromosome 3, complete genome n=2 Tax=Gibberella zeae TaxID=5518 RepID=A0A098E356_GIBZE|nr:unnamed protein product [Fusarium graminearum]CAF3515507.1 unnamed protein product [Fusarium graminearum]CAF3533180.1 unnamed protein product [Fusarium graminearum]CAG1967412.1 unnamed protein product [Fusarium graminearum]CAG1977638.1 unnamed protein product [Fusarium graminearum]
MQSMVSSYLMKLWKEPFFSNRKTSIDHELIGKLCCGEARAITVANWQKCLSRSSEAENLGLEA